MANLVLLFYFAFSLLLTLLCPLATTSIPLHFFYPYLIFVLYQKPLQSSLIQAFICGLFLDLLSSTLPLGFFAACFILSLYLFNRLKHLFFIDKIMTLPILTFLFSSLLTLMYRLNLNIFCVKSPITLKWVLTDVFILPLGDACFALLFFAFPLKFLSKWINRDRKHRHSLNFKKSGL